MAVRVQFRWLTPGCVGRLTMSTFGYRRATAPNLRTSSRFLGEKGAEWPKKEARGQKSFKKVVKKGGRWLTEGVFGVQSGGHRGNVEAETTFRRTFIEGRGADQWKVSLEGMSVSSTPRVESRCQRPSETVWNPAVIWSLGRTNASAWSLSPSRWPGLKK